MKKVIIYLFLSFSFHLYVLDICKADNCTCFDIIDTVTYLFFDSQTEAQAERDACAYSIEPPRYPLYSCPTCPSLSPTFQPGGGCQWYIESNTFCESSATVQCYYWLYEEPDDDCCKDDEGTCCPPGAKKCPDDKVGNPISVMSGNNGEMETDLQFNTSHEKRFNFYRTCATSLIMALF